MGCASTALKRTICTDTNDDDSDGVVINEFRTRGPAGGNDEFIEFRNDFIGWLAIGGCQIAGSNNSGATTNCRNIPVGTVM